ncbi:histone deacetylation protein Rxt3-domain-containing protein [Syncephalis pseudoplumigaleata]|uniref:Histone deacetylation protein Rxt3-domain-containing protein n=1 Tax=Syncephalis pseudoplumigaleata TaxID=1712513 RepID=A0A4V1J1Y0_9FUNG|nr:histone deacetylation protein Rxt3-domain-containing protein [Syncephalis pseudoplumigaleata]|eukprot:RKP26629.1 histone deacetylation protein Rxt3-domain-containing protein [Syncephalis pseudoplumigaleata]
METIAVPATTTRAQPADDATAHSEANNSPSTDAPSTADTFVVVRNAAALGLNEPPDTAVHLGFFQYEPDRLLPPLAGRENGVLVVRIPSAWLTFTNPAVKQRRIWGTDIYTDDSDVVAALIHTGKYTPLSPHPLLQQQQQEEEETAREHRRRGIEDKAPCYDLKVTLRVVSRLQRYTGTVRHCIRSRDWTEHDGGSYMIYKVEQLPLGTAYGRGAGSQRSKRIRAFCQARKRVMQA